MSEGIAPLPAPDREQSWDRITACIEAFVQAWDLALLTPIDSEESKSLSIQNYLPSEAPEVVSIVLVELIKVDMEYRWQHQRAPKLLEAYAIEFHHVGSIINAELVYEEYHLRRSAGDIVTRREYRERFPNFVPTLEKLWENCEGSESPTNASTVLVRKQTDIRQPVISPPTGNRLSELRPGEILDEFQILRKLGQGAFGTVYLAMQQSLQRLVALKISPDRGDEPRTLAQMDHEHIVRVFDQRLLEDRGVRIMYMQYVSGGTLTEVVKRVRTVPAEQRTGKLLFDVLDEVANSQGETSLSSSRMRTKLSAATWPEVVCWIGARLSAALDYAHRHGVIHRDLKPANVLLTIDGTPKLVDFNISFSKHVAGSSAAAYFGGSLAYMSPEQLEAAHPAHSRQPADLDGRSDLYSLAILLCELLTGHRPFQDSHERMTWTQTLDHLLEQRRKGCDNVAFEGEESWPEGLATTLRRCLSPAPENRPRDAEELNRALELCLRPRARQLLYSKETGLFKWLTAHPLLSLISAAAVPNSLFVVFNIYYNSFEVSQKHPELLDTISSMQTLMIGLTCPPAFFAAIWYAWSISLAVKNRNTPNDRLIGIRHRCAHFGHTASIISLATWMISGFAFALLAGARLTTFSEQIQITISIMLRGLMAAVYPFFPTTLVALRLMYPRLVKLSSMREQDEQSLELLRKRISAYLILTAVVPMLTLGLLVQTDSPSTTILSFLVFRAGASLAILLLVARMILDDIAALQLAVRSRRWPDD